MVLFFSCQNEGRWYPDAEVKIFKYYEYTPTGGGKGLHITAVIHNTGSTTITTGAVTVKAATDTHEYLQTITINGGIIPGGNIAVSVAITYLDASEQITSDGVTVYDAFFN
jgi:fructose-1-phosphate kinase PfkB-like protein